MVRRSGKASGNLPVLDVLDSTFGVFIRFLDRGYSLKKAGSLRSTSAYNNKDTCVRSNTIVDTGFEPEVIITRIE